jgi:hypothetical protein
MVGVQEFFDDGKNVLGMDRDGTFFLHSSFAYLVLVHPSQRMYHKRGADKLAGKIVNYAMGAALPFSHFRSLASKFLNNTALVFLQRAFGIW